MKKLIDGPPHQRLIKYIWSIFGFYPIRSKNYLKILKEADQLKSELSVFKKKLDLLQKIPADKTSFFAKFINQSHSQFFQDLFFASEFANDKPGYFVEIGACDGVALSNTLFFENVMNWRGILAEPAKKWHSDLKKNRAADIDTRAVAGSSGEMISFIETEDARLSTFQDLKNNDFQADYRTVRSIYKVETVSLEDLLQKYNAPHIINFLSLDTEGSEYEILKNFNFDQRRILSLCCEHNFTKNREKVFNLLSAKGYEQKFKEFSVCDDWYFLKMK